MGYACCIRMREVFERAEDAGHERATASSDRVVAIVCVVIWSGVESIAGLFVAMKS